jgi:hypothetical protein
MHEVLHLIQSLASKKEQFNSASKWMLVAHACNPSYSGSRDQEDHGSQPAWGNSS